MAAKDWIPNTKIMAVGIAYTISDAIIDVIQNRAYIALSDPEKELIVMVISLAIGYLVPEKQGNALPKPTRQPQQ